jgi:hypothetical protein
MNPAADEMVPKRETTERQLEDAAAAPFDSLKEQLRAVFEERPSRQSKPVEDLHGSDDRLDEPLRTTRKDFQRPSPQRKPEEEDEPVERDDLRLGITSYPDHEASERQANYDLLIENKMTRRSSRGFARYLVAILFGVAATLAWQSYGDVAKQIIATRAPELGSSPEAKQMIANSIQQLGWTKPPAGPESTAVRPPAPQTVASTSKAPAPPSPDPQQVQQIETDIAAVRQAVERHFADVRATVEQLAASQDQMAREITKLQASNQEILGKIPAPPPKRLAPARKPTPIAPPSSPAPVAPPTSLAPIPRPDQ